MSRAEERTDSRTTTEGPWDQPHRPFQLESRAYFLCSCHCRFSCFLYLSCLWICHFLKPPSFLREKMSFYSKQEKVKKISWSIFYLSNPGVLCKRSCVSLPLHPTPCPVSSLLPEPLAHSCLALNTFQVSSSPLSLWCVFPSSMESACSLPHVFFVRF